MLSRIVCSFCRPVYASKYKPFFNLSFQTYKNYKTQTNLLEVNTNVIKDVILYKSDNARFFKYLNLFGISQFVFWIYLAQWSYSSLRDAPVDIEKLPVDTPWYKKINLGENKYRNGITTLCLVVGYVMLAGSWLFTLRSVKYLVLLKGGRSVSFVTYTPFGENRIMNVPLKYVSAVESRQTAKVSLPLKVQGKWLFYLLDMRGEFRNNLLFDATVGISRGFAP